MQTKYIITNNVASISGYTYTQGKIITILMVVIRSYNEKIKYEDQIYNKIHNVIRIAILLSFVDARSHYE